jgi:hypothetical protein
MLVVENGYNVNESLGDVIVLLEHEVERLRESLEIYRLSGVPDRAARIRWHVVMLDERQDALEQLRDLLRRRRVSS